MSTIRIQLLGPVRVRRAGTHLLLGGAFRRAIVARLALTPGEPVPTDELVHALWSEAPSAAVSSLRAQVSRLRQGELGPVIGGGRGGYVLDAAAVDIDIDRLRRLGAEQSTVVWDPSLVAGVPLADLDGFPFVADARARLADHRSASIEGYAERMLADDDARGALDVLTSLLEVGDDVRERTVLLAAEASARLGRSAEALELIDDFERTREVRVGGSGRTWPSEVQRFASDARGGASGRDGMPRSASPGEQAACRFDGRVGVGVGVRVRERIAAGFDAGALREAIVRFDPAVSPVRTTGLVARRGIPLPVSSFVGRSDELACLAAARRASRLITLVGPGGVGKTRLAIESARRVEHPEDDEQWMLELAPLRAPGLVLDALADRIGVDHTIDAVSRHLGGRRVLLVLDNAEHLRAEVSRVVVELLAECPGLTVLVTTREALRVPGEKVVPVSPMSIDDSGDAVALFTARAGDAAPGFDSGDDVQRCIRTICARLDGLPLALELAAARLDVLELDELRRSIETGGLMGDASATDLVDPAVPSTASRHASLRSTIGWSVDLLTPAERLLLRQLAWFAGPFRLEAVDAVCRSDEPHLDGRPRAARDLLLDLTRKSLVAVDSVAGHRLYRLLESVKTFVREHENEPACPEVHAAWSARHVDHFAEWAIGVDAMLRGPGAREGHALLDAARPDLQLATPSALAAGDRENALRLAGGQAWHWFRRGTFTRARGWIDDALDLPGHAEPLTLARAHFGAVMNIHRSGDEFAGERYALEGAEAAERSGDPTMRALFAACTGMWRATAGDLAGHDERMQRALALLQVAEPWAAGDVHLFRGIAKGYLDKPAQALEAFAEAHRTAKASGHRWAADAAAQRLAHLYIKLRRGHDAVAHVRAAVHGAVSDGDMHAVVTTLHTGAAACALLERHGDGAALLGVVDTVAVRFGYDKRSVEPPYWSGYRDRVRQGLPTAMWKREYTRGTRLGIGDAIRLLDQLAS